MITKQNELACTKYCNIYPMCTHSMRFILANTPQGTRLPTSTTTPRWSGSWTVTQHQIMFSFDGRTQLSEYGWCFVRRAHRGISLKLNMVGSLPWLARGSEFYLCRPLATLSQDTLPPPGSHHSLALAWSSLVLSCRAPPFRVDFCWPQSHVFVSGWRHVCLANMRYCSIVW